VSARTGLQTAIGWYFHEVQWRGESAANQALLARRQELTDGIYLAPDTATVLASMHELGARYIVLGNVERARYPNEAIPNFGEFLDLVAEFGDVQLFRMPEYEVIPTS
jgi:uncharacterized membrane protein